MRRSIPSVLFILAVLCTLLLLGFNPVIASNNKPIELKFASDIPPFAPICKVWQQWGKDMGEKTGGRINIKFYLGGTLMKSEVMRRGLLRGLCDVSNLTIDHDPIAYSLNSIVQLPILGISEMKTATRIWKDAIDKYPEMAAEFKGTKLFFPVISLSSYIHTKKIEVRIPQDLKGVKISGLGSTLKIIDALGASPVNLMPMEWYLGLERGIAEGSIAVWPAVGVFRAIKLLHYHNETPVSYLGQFFVIRMKTWKNLSPDIQKTFNDSMPWLEKTGNESSAADIVKFKKIARDSDHTFIVNAPEEIEKWKQMVKPLHKEWITKNEAKGKPAKAIYDYFQKRIAEYNQ